jgi:hypothetical protein
MRTITVIDYDRVTQFNATPIEQINEHWGDVPYILVYADGEFTSMAQPKGSKTLEEWRVYFQNYYDEGDAQVAAEALKVSEESAEREAILMGLADLYELIEGAE